MRPADRERFFDHESISGSDWGSGNHLVGVLFLRRASLARTTTTKHDRSTITHGI